MKIFLALILMSATTAFAAPTALLTYNYSSGFMPHPVSAMVVVYDNGSVESTQYVSQGSVLKKHPLAKLSASAMTQIKTDIADLDATAKLIDHQAEAPRCMDAPDITMSVSKDNKQVVIYRWAGCHTFELENGVGSELQAILNGFALLR